jgi:hypothetical protein
MNEKFEFDNMVIISLSGTSNCENGCDSSGTEGSGCDCDSPN